MTGVGSGLDVDGIVTALVSVSREPITRLNTRISNAKAAATTVSDIATLISRLGTAVRELDDITETKTYTASSSSSAITVSATGAAQPGSYSVKVTGLAKEARVYSNTFDSSSEALGETGTLSFTIAGKTATVDIGAEDSLDAIATRINEEASEQGLRLSATTFYDGSHYRLLLNGLDKGSANALTIQETDLDFGLNLEANIKQVASNATAEIDGFPVSSATNQITAAIPGVTLALTGLTSQAETVTIASDPAALKTKLQSVVDAYNAIVNKVHSAAGYGSTKATNSVLAGDSGLRTVTSRMSSVVMTRVETGSQYETLASIGVSQNSDGTLTIDSSRLQTALAADPTAVSQVLAGPSGSEGVMDVLSDLADSLSATGTGLLRTKVDLLNQQATTLQQRADDAQDRLDAYAERVRAQLNAADSAMGSSYSTLSYLVALFG
ncbi:MAG: flagellar filament capping protein FliD [Polyangiaceae bacterium]|nr:flagellar filament capping protein FliD [Polyangiaceae bacterium]